MIIITVLLQTPCYIRYQWSALDKLPDFVSTPSLKLALSASYSRVRKQGKDYATHDIPLGSEFSLCQGSQLLQFLDKTLD